MAARHDEIEPNSNPAHIHVMVTKSAKLSATPPPSGMREGWYRGVKLQSPAKPPTIPLARMRAAVDRAIAKNADALAGRE